MTGESSPLLALEQFAALVDDCPANWLVGGSVGLYLRGAPLPAPPRDLDVYADASSIPLLHRRLVSYVMDGPNWDETDRYRSLLSHYQLAESQVELVGDFTVSSRSSVYVTEVDSFLYAGSERARIAGREVGLMPLAHEFIFNLLRERPDRAQLAAGIIRAYPEAHLPALRTLIGRNRIAPAVIDEMWTLLDLTGAREERAATE